MNVIVVETTDDYGTVTDAFFGPYSTAVADKLIVQWRERVDALELPDPWTVSVSRRRLRGRTEIETLLYELQYP